MCFSVELLQGEPIVIVTVQPTFDPLINYDSLFSQLGSVLRGVPGPIYRITELLAGQITFSDMTTAIEQEANSGKPGSTGDARIRSILVSRALLAQTAVSTIARDQYGGLDVPLFGTLSEALAYARAELAKEL